MLLSVYFQSFKKQCSLVKEEFFLFVSLLLYCFAQALPLFFKVNFSFILFTLSITCCLLSIIFRFLGLFIGFSIFFVIFYLYIVRLGFSFVEILWLEGCLLSSCLSLSIFLLKMDDLVKKNCHRNYESHKKFNQLQTEKQKCLQVIQNLELINIKTADFCSMLGDKNKKDEEIIHQILEEKQLLEQQVKLLSDQKLFWISNYDDLHKKFVKLIPADKLFEEQGVEENLYELNNANKDLQKENDKLKQDFCLLDLKYKGLLQKFEEEKKILCEQEFPRIDSCESSSELSYVRGQYNQLKDQFEDKKYQLHITRQQLFKLEEANTSRKREKVFFLTERHNDIADFCNFEKTISLLEEEVTHLEELISHILSR